jgi:hypothetical protein
MVHSRRPAAATQLDVEKMIIDFLLHMASSAVLEDYSAHMADPSTLVRQKSLQHLQTVHCKLPLDFVTPLRRKLAFSAIFKKHFSSERLEAAASFRLRLLKFSVMLSRRTIPGTSTDFSPILDSLRTSHGRRSTQFSSSRSSCPLHRGYQQQLPIGVEYRRHYVEVLRENGATEIRPPLIELQTIFFKLSAYRGVLESSDLSLRRDWMNLAGQFMLQSAIEQLLVYKAQDLEVLRDVFSWTWKADKNADEIHVVQGEEEMAEWEHIRNCWAAAVSFRAWPCPNLTLTVCSSVLNRRRRPCHAICSALPSSIRSMSLRLS